MTIRSMRNVMAALALVAASTTACLAITSLRSQSVAGTASSFPAIADTYADADSRSENFGTAGQVVVDGSPVRHAYLKFAVQGLAQGIVSARLRLQVRDTTGSSSAGVGVVRSVSNDGWSETQLDWSNRPAIDGPTIGTFGPVTRDTWYEIDVTSAITGNGTYSFGLSTVSTDGARFDSRETGANGPQLVVSTDATVSNPGPGSQPAVLVGAGDIANCTNSNDSATANLLDDIPGTVFTAGDASYPDGSAANFANCYDPTWGRHKARTRPAPGNHEYRTDNASAYFDYFGAAAGSPGRGYYSYDLGAWHVVVLNSNCNKIGGCQAGSAQERWLRQDLAASAKSCTVAIWHHPLFTSGATHPPETEIRPLYQALYDNDADLLINGHNHQYERFAPLNPSGQRDDANGIRNFVVGTGGAGLYGFDAASPHSEVRSTTHGVLKLTLSAGEYDWEFVPVAGKSFRDSGTGRCH